MVLVTGGERSGKREFAENLGYSRAQMSDAALLAGGSDPAGGICTPRQFDELTEGCPVIVHGELFGVSDPEIAAQLADRMAEKELVIVREVGSGIIPLSREEREFRENAGRMSVLLAKRADTVVRMVCGIPTVIKGKL